MVSGSGVDFLRSRTGAAYDASLYTDHSDITRLTEV